MKETIGCAVLALAISAGQPIMVGAEDYAVLDENSSSELLLFQEIPNVITSTLTEKKANQAPATVTVITEKDILNSGCKTLLELLQRVNGLAINSYRINFRGVAAEDNQKMKFILNGHEMSTPFWLTNIIDNLTLENIRQIEFVHGPGSSIYGDNSFIGTISIITKSPEEMDGVLLSENYGSYNTNHASAAFGQTFGDYALGATISHYTTSGNDANVVNKDEAYGTPCAITPGKYPIPENRIAAMIDISYQDLSIAGFYSKWISRQYAPVMNFLTQDKAVEDSAYVFLDAKYSMKLNEAGQVMMKAAYDNVKQSIYGQMTPDNFAIGVDTGGDGIPDWFDINMDGIDEIWPNGTHADFGYTSDMYKVQAMLDYKLLEENELLLGIFYSNLKSRDIYTKSEMSPMYFNNPGEMTDYSRTENFNKPAERSDVGAFIQDEWYITSEWYLILGGRYDQYSDVGSTFNPRCGIIWSFDQSGNVKLLYGTAYRAPNFSDLYNQNNPVLVGNPKLKPETMETVELAVSHIWNNLQSDLSLYHEKMENLLGWKANGVVTVAGPQIEYVNANKAWVWGIELTEKYACSADSSIFLGYAYAKDETPNVVDISRQFKVQHQGRLGLDIKLIDLLSWDFIAIYTDEIGSGIKGEEFKFAPTTVLDTTLHYGSFFNFDFYLTVKNILNTEIRRFSFDPSMLAPESGINYRFGINYKF